MSKKKGAAILASGVLLVVLSLIVFLYNQVQDQRAGQLAQTKLEALQTAMGHNGALSLEPQQVPASSIRQNAVELDGERYIGYLSIPALELELPVMSDWDYEKLKSAPCRQFGSAKTDDLVIAAHNYKKHFAQLTRLEKGDGVLFCEVDGTVHSYAVVQISTVAPTEVDRVKNSKCDLVLYTCTYGGKARTVVFCNRTGA